MPSTSRGSNAATFLAVLLAIVLAIAWLRSSDGASPAVPTGLSVETVPAVPPEAAAPDGVAPPTRDREGKRVAGDRAVRKPQRAMRDMKRERVGRTAQKGKHGSADRAGGREDARARVKDPGARLGGQDPIGQDPPATAPAPAQGSAGTGTADGANAPAAPEFALE